MALVNYRNEIISDEDASVLFGMVQDSLESHVKKLHELKAEKEKNAPGFYDPLIEIYEKGLSDVTKKLKDAHNSDENINLDDFLRSIFSELSAEAAAKVDKTSPYFKNSFLSDLALQWEEKNFLTLYGQEGGVLAEAEEDYIKTVAPFKLTTEPMEGVEGIGEYNPNSDGVKVLYEGRKGNSATMQADIPALEKQLQDLQAKPVKKAADEKK